MSRERDLLRHFVATLAYRTRKALLGAPEHFPDFAAGNHTRTPTEIIRHMSDLMGSVRRFHFGDEEASRPEPLPTFREEVLRFHGQLESVAALLEDGEGDGETTIEQILQGPLSDAMTHVGQLALLRRLADSPIPPENFMRADVSLDRLGADDAVSAGSDGEDRFHATTKETDRP